MSLTRRVERLEGAMMPAGNGQQLVGWPDWPPDGNLYVYLPSGGRVTADEALELGFHVVEWVPWIQRED